ncbi:MAG: phosphatase PAP2 family protein [Candidatus Enteromonas sp.]|nr:phosphatase PAP2 family protein [Candidatus Enteromonas sp.]
MNLWERIAVYGAVLVAFVVSLFLDLKITQSLYDPENLFGQIFELIAELPAFTLVVFALSCLAFHHPKFEKKWLNILLTAVFFALALAASLYGGNHFRHLLNRVTHLDFPSWLTLVYSLVYLACGVPWVFMIKNPNVKEICVFGASILCMFVVTLGVMQGLKMLWLRPRYRTLVALYGENAASYWLPVYQPQGFWSFSKYGTPGNSVLKALGIQEWGKEEFYSFPSGHTLHAVVPMAITLLFPLFPKLEGKQGYVRIGFYVWGALTAVSRILRGAHNLSDVAFGFFLGVLAFDLVSTFLLPALRKLYEKIFERKPIPQKEA